MSSLTIFLYGALGALAIELITVYQHSLTDRPVPARYRQPGFWVVRLLMVVVAGGLPLTYGVEQPLLALHIGASAPLIIQSLARGAIAEDRDA